MKPAILCVDDEADIVASLERLFRKKYDVHKAHSGSEALSVLKSHRQICVIITDQRMPQMSGVEFLEKSLESHPDAVRILLTGYTDIDSIIDAINSGQVYRYVTKPWDPVDLSNAVDRAVEKYDLQIALKEKNRALEAALAELRTLDSAKNQFMMLINHELKTPLTSMLSYIELLYEVHLNEEQRKYLDRVRQSGERIHEIILTVLDLISAETGQLKVEISDCSWPEVWTLSETVRNLALQKNIRVATNIEVERVHVDRKILNRVLEALVQNAIKFGNPNSLVTLKVMRKDGSELQVSVQNESTQDLSESNIKKILKPFTLLEEVLHHSTGLGLGLPLSQALLKRHGSQLHIHKRGEKVEVSFSLPDSSSKIGTT